METKNKIYPREALKEQVARWKAAGEKIVFTNGCFDILHLGHVDYLEKAAALGTKLIVALNTDASVSELKGPERPVNKEEARTRLIAALGFVDAVTLFGEATPEALIHVLVPDILVKGDDYTVSNIVGSDFVLANGGTVETIPLVKGYSTTNIIEKLRREEEK